MEAAKGLSAGPVSERTMGFFIRLTALGHNLKAGKARN
jgi:hypothetical protein